MQNSTVIMIRRMYRDHEYTVKEIHDRLRVPELTVASVLGIKNYTVEETPLHINKDNETMIFPQLPRRIDYVSTVNTVNTETPLQGIDCAQPESKPNIAEWWIKHGLATDPAALTTAKQGPIDWWAQDAWELYAITVGFAVWIAYWLGIHRGLW